MRKIKKSVKFTTVHVFGPDLATMTLKDIDTFTFAGTLGERLLASKVRREYGANAMHDSEVSERCYAMDVDTFIKYATPIEASELDADEDDEDDED